MSAGLARFDFHGQSVRTQADPQVRITGKGLTWLHRHLEGVAPLTEQPALAVVS